MSSLFLSSALLPDKDLYVHSTYWNEMAHIYVIFIDANNEVDT